MFDDQDRQSSEQPPEPPRLGGTKRTRRKSLPRTHRTLAVVLESLRDEHLVFELKNDTQVGGMLYDVDTNLNANLVDATVTDFDGRTHRVETTYVNGSMIRYVRLPDKVRQPLDPRFSETRRCRSTPCAPSTSTSTLARGSVAPRCGKSAPSLRRSTVHLPHRQ